MSVKLYKSKIKEGYSFYLRYDQMGKQWNEFLGIKIRKSDDPVMQEENRKNIELAKRIRAERDRDISDSRADYFNLE
jgi:Arm DNA-binding domain